jgi:hypothetical protein
MRAINEQIPAVDFSKCVLSSATRGVAPLSGRGGVERLGRLTPETGEGNEWLAARVREITCLAGPGGQIEGVSEPSVNVSSELDVTQI